MTVFLPDPVRIPDRGVLAPGEHDLDEDTARLLLDRGLALPVEGRGDEEPVKAPRKKEERKERR